MQEWRSSRPVAYAEREGHAVVLFDDADRMFEFQLPGAVPLKVEATCPSDVDKLRCRLEATLPSARDIRTALAFVERYAVLAH